MLKNKWIDRMILFTIIVLYTGAIVYVCSIPRYTRFKGWTTPSNGIVFKTDEGYVNFGNGEILDFGDGMKVRIKIENIEDGDVVE